MALHVEPFSGGLVTSSHPALLDEGELLVADNIIYRPGDQSPYLRDCMAIDLDSTSLPGGAVALKDIKFSTGHQYLLVLTSAGVYSSPLVGTSALNFSLLKVTTTTHTSMNCVLFGDEWYILLAGDTFVIYQSDGGTLQTRNKGVATVTNAPTVSTCAAVTSIPVVGSGKYYEYWYTEAVEYTKNGIKISVEGGCSDNLTPASVEVSASNVCPIVTIPPAIDPTTTKFYIYRAGPKDATTTRLFPAGLRVATVTPASSGNTTWVDGASTTPQSIANIRPNGLVGATSFNNTANMWDSNLATYADVTVTSSQGPRAHGKAIRACQLNKFDFLAVCSTGLAGRLSGLSVSVCASTDVAGAVTLGAVLCYPASAAGGRIVPITDAVDSTNDISRWLAVDEWSAGPTVGQLNYTPTQFNNYLDGTLGNSVISGYAENSYYALQACGKIFPPISTTIGSPTQVSVGGATDNWGALTDELYTKTDIALSNTSGSGGGAVTVMLVAFINASAGTVNLRVHDVKVTLWSPSPSNPLTSFQYITLDTSDLQGSFCLNTRMPVGTTAAMYEGSMLQDVDGKGGQLVYSAGGNPDGGPSPYTLTLDDPTAVYGVVALNNKSVAITRNGKFRVNYLPTEDDASFGATKCWEVITPTHGAVNRDAIATHVGADGRQMVAAVSDDGVWSTDGYADVDLTADLDFTALRAAIGNLETGVLNLTNDALESRLLLTVNISGTGVRQYALHYHPSHLKENGRAKITGPIEPVLSGALTSVSGDITAVHAYVLGTTAYRTIMATMSNATPTPHTTIVSNRSIISSSGAADADMNLRTRWIIPSGAQGESIAHEIGLLGWNQNGTLSITGNMLRKNRTTVVTAVATGGLSGLIPQGKLDKAGTVFYFDVKAANVTVEVPTSRAVAALTVNFEDVGSADSK